MTLEEKKQVVDKYIGKRVYFMVNDGVTHQLHPQEFTLKSNEINLYLDMVVSYFEETAPRYFVNSEILYLVEGNTKKTIF